MTDPRTPTSDPQERMTGAPGFCFDIDGNWWNKHGPGSGCPYCDAPARTPTSDPVREALTDLDGGLRDAALEYVETWDAYHVEDNQYTESRLRAVYRTRDFLADALAGDLIEYPPLRALLAASPEPASPEAPGSGLDVERLARALYGVHAYRTLDDAKEVARDIAREYDRLAARPDGAEADAS